jgi:hypothetical protein
MKKILLALTLLVSLNAFAMTENNCHEIRLFFVTIVTGTYQVEEIVGYDQNGQPIKNLVTKKCSEGNRWQWFWE